jgi:hypothetical protein
MPRTQPQPIMVRGTIRDAEDTPNHGLRHNQKCLVYNKSWSEVQSEMPKTQPQPIMVRGTIRDA